MNPKGTASGGDSPRSKNNGGSGGGSVRGGGGHGGGRGGDPSDGEEMEESGLSDDEDDEELLLSAGAAGGGSGVDRRKNNEEDEEGDGDEDTSEDDEDGGEEEDDDEEEEEGEDSSDMDVQECERKRFEYIDDLTDLEKQFAILREQLYRERITQIEAKLAEVKSGRAPEYLQPLEELQENMKNRMEVGAVLRELRLANIQCKHDAEMLATEQNFQSEKELLIDSIRADLEEKIHMLEEDKHNVDFSSGLWEQSSGKSRKRKADALDPDRRKKPVTVTGPYIVYMLHECDILDDWTVIKKSIAQRKKT